MSRKISEATIKLLIPFLALVLGVISLSFKAPFTGAFLNSMVQAANNYVQSGEFTQPCEAGEKWLYAVVDGDTTQGLRKNDTPITDPLRTNPEQVLGIADSGF